MNRIVLILLTGLIALSSCDPQPVSRESKLLRDAAGFLWAQQEEDGAWRSAQHGLLRSGSAYTPYVLYALLQVPDSVYAPPVAQRDLALEFIRSDANAFGVLGLSDPDLMEYPNYSTAFALLVLTTVDDPRDKGLINKMQTYLVAQQFNDRRGIGPTHPAYGGWGFGEQGLNPANVGHVDLSHTRRVLQALRQSGYADQKVYTDAEKFLQLTQKHPADPRNRQDSLRSMPYDGGFFYSPVLPETNKAKVVPETDSTQAHFRSYATATSDGLLSLLAIGAPEASEPVQAAANWLRTNDRIDFPGGIPTDDPDEWYRVMVFYHLCVRAQAMQAIGDAGEWKGEMLDLLEKEVREDGSFSNPEGARNKEDDPILATAFAVRALACMLRK